MTRRVAYIGARLVDPLSGRDAPGGLLTEGARIVDLGPRLFAEGAPESATHVACDGHVLAPGLIDARANLCEPGAVHKEDIASAGLAAAAGGVTTILALPNTDPVIDDVALVAFVARRAREAKRAKIYCYAAATRGAAGDAMSEIGLLREAGAVAFTDGVKTIANAGMFRRILKYGQAFDALIVQHPEEPSLASGLMNRGEMATRLGLSGIPCEAETIMIARDLRLVAAVGGRYHAAHVSTEDSIALIAEAKARGLDVTCDTAPPYFGLNEIAVGDYRSFAKLSPPLRDERDRRAVVQGIASGAIDIIASDHQPQDQESKRLPFAQAAFGGVGLETLLPLVLELVHNGHMSLAAALAPVTCRPAARFGLPGGRLAVGAPADLVLFDPDRPIKITAERLRSKSKNSPFDGRLTQGVVLRTVVDGRTVFAAPPSDSGGT